MKIFKGLKASEPVPVALVMSDSAVAMIQQVVSTMPGFPMEVRADLNALATAENMELSTVSVLLIEVDLGQMDAVARLEQLAVKSQDHTALIVIAHNLDSRTTRRLFRAGATDVLSFPVSSDELTAALIASLKPRAPRKRTSRSGRIISVQKCGGGVGASMLVANLGQLLSEADDRAGQSVPKVLLLDLDPQFGNLASITHCEPRASILQLIEAGDRLDSTLFQSVVQPLGAHLDLLAAPDEILPLSALSPGFVGRMLEVAAANYDYIIIDHPQNWGGQTEPVFSRSAAIILVMEPNVEHADRARAALNGIRELNLKTDNTLMVINKSLGLLHSDRIGRIEKVLQRPCATIPFQEKVHTPAREQSRFLSTISGSKVQIKALNKVIRAMLDLVQANDQQDIENLDQNEPSSVQEALQS
ncbi:MAG: AAA family ATPase [Henriciella sp.]